MVTFDRHPKVVVAPDQAPRQIYSPSQKHRTIESLGVDAVWEIHFDKPFSEKPADEFIRELARDLGKIHSICVGAAFVFGHLRTGNVALLKTLGAELHFQVHGLAAVALDGQPVSSTRVREMIRTGNFDAASQMLGRPYAISGHVIHGQQLGRQLGESSARAADGFRTLNVRFDHPKPAAAGIFAVRTHGLLEQPLDGVASLGVRPTVEDRGRVLLEVHCLDWPAALGPEGGYGKIISVELLHKLRDEARYDGLDALTAAIAQDAVNARAFFAAHAALSRQTSRDRIR